MRHLPLALLLLAVALVYANSLHNSFHFDDYHTIVENPAIRSLRNLPRLLTDATAFSVLPPNRTWRPVVSVSLAVDYAMARGYNTLWFHLSTLIWFGVLLIVIERFIELLLNRTEPSRANRWLALGITAWFGLHPAMAETVNYIIQRGDLYCTLGCISALYVFARWRHLRWTCIYLLPFVLAMLSKPPAIAFPFLLVLYVFYFETDPAAPSTTRWKRSAFATWPAFATAAALLALNAAMTPRTYTPTDLSAWTYRLTQPYVWLRYAGQLFLPLHLNADTDLRRFTSITPAVAAGLLFAGLLLALIALCSRKKILYPIAFGLAWFLLTQLPTSLYALSEVENDHRMFFSFPGLMLAVVWSLHLAYKRVLQRVSPSARKSAIRVTTAATLLALGAYAWGAHVRNEVWRSEETLWADDVVKCPRNGRGLMMYGTTLLNSGRPGPALIYFQRALAFTPNYPDLELNLGVASGVLADEGNAALTQSPEQHFQRALLLAPADDRVHSFYARWLLAHSRVDEAAAQAATAVQLNPTRALGRDFLLQAEVEQGQLDAARDLARETLHLIPDDAQAQLILNGGPALNRMRRDGLINASLASYRAGQYQQSIAQARAALALDANSAEAWNNIGASQAALGQWDQAIDDEKTAFALNPQLLIAQNNLRAYTSQWEAAAHTSPQARRVSALIQQSLELYRAADYRNSATAARKAVTLDPNSAEAWNNVAAAEAAQHHWNAAIAAAERAIALKPGLEIAHNNLAWALQQRDIAAKK
jgi:tetratricopeptide (TPR) repeat protein